MDNYDDDFVIQISDSSHIIYAEKMAQLLAQVSNNRNVAIAKRSVGYLAAKLRERKVVIAFYGKELAGFCYAETWENKRYVTHSGLVVVPIFRGHHLATRIKQLLFALSRQRWPEAQLVDLTNSSIVMHIDSLLGYVLVPFDELPQEDTFWRGCGTKDLPYCIHSNVLEQSGRKFCVCSAMRYDPLKHIGDELPAAVPEDVLHFIQKSRW